MPHSRLKKEGCKQDTKKKHVKYHNQVSNPHVLAEQVECTSAMILQCSTIFCGGLNWVRFSGC